MVFACVNTITFLFVLTVWGAVCSYCDAFVDNLLLFNILLFSLTLYCSCLPTLCCSRYHCVACLNVVLLGGIFCLFLLRFLFVFCFFKTAALSVLTLCCYINTVLFVCSALVWGTSVKHCPQKVGKEHILNDEDVVQILKKSVVIVAGLLSTRPDPLCISLSLSDTHTCTHTHIHTHIHTHTYTHSLTHSLFVSH